MPFGAVGVPSAAMAWLTSVRAPSCRKPLPITTSTTLDLDLMLNFIALICDWSVIRNSARTTCAAATVLGPK